MIFLGFFLVVMTTIVVGGYLLVAARPAAEEAAMQHTGLGQAGDLQPIVKETLQSLGETLPIRGKKADALRVRLFRAGYRDPAMVTVFQGARALVAATTAMIPLWVGLRNPEANVASIALGLVAGAGVGSLLPDRWLDWRVRARARRIRSALSPALELITLAVEAGQSLDAAIENAASSLRRVHPDLCDELRFYLLEIRAGTSRLDALAHLSARSPEAEVKKLAAVLTDAERFGASLGPALRTHMKFLRIHMRFQAQAAARKLSVKLVFPVFFLIFPAVLLVTLGPAYLQIEEFFSKLLQ